MDNLKKKAILDILRIARKREVEAFNYYKKASEKAPYSETKSLFIQLAEEERKHRFFLTKEMQKIEQLLIDETEESFLRDAEVQYPIPDDIDFQKIQSTPGIDLAAVSLPVELLGGDYMDTVILEREGRAPSLGIFLYDVMGHGMDATQLKALGRKVFGKLREDWMRGLGHVDMSRPQQVMMEVNRKLIGDCQSTGRFVSVFYGVVDPAGKTMTYTSAGHDPPILINFGGDYVHLNETELVLGVDKDVNYSEVNISIDTVDVLILFSDGITEAGDPKGKMFEREGLYMAAQEAKRSSAQEIVSHIFNELRKFLRGSPITDDFTLAVMKIGSKE